MLWTLTPLLMMWGPVTALWSRIQSSFGYNTGRSLLFRNQSRLVKCFPRQAGINFLIEAITVSVSVSHRAVINTIINTLMSVQYGWKSQITKKNSRFVSTVPSWVCVRVIPSQKQNAFSTLSTYADYSSVVLLCKALRVTRLSPFMIPTDESGVN